MASHLDMSLDDIAKSQRTSEGGNGNRRGGRKTSNKSGKTSGPVRQGRQRKNTRRSQPYETYRIENHRIENHRTERRPESKTILLQNLGDDVNEQDLKEILMEVGAITWVKVDRYEGRSQGSAKVTFRHPSDAASAVKEFDKAKVDGRPMYIQLERGQGDQRGFQNQNPRLQTQKRPRPNRGNERGSGRGRGNNRRAGRGGGRGSRGGRGGRGGRGRGGGHGRSKDPEAKKEDLDAEMEAYQNQRSTTQE